MTNTNIESIPVRFAAIEPYVDTRIISGRETPSKNGDYVNWGEGNAFPDYLLELYGRCATLRTVINACVDYASGNGADLAAGSLQWGENIVNDKDMTADELVRCLANDFYLYGGFALQVIRDRAGRV